VIELSTYVPVRALTEYLGALSLIGLVAMFWDKLMAKAGLERLSERSLAGIAGAGGFAGIIAGGLFAHHKTSKREFWVPVGFATFFWGTFLTVYFFPRIL
jgi:uncharacterized membrane protein YsdA (DUF1294 family)